MDLKELQAKVDSWIKKYGVRYFNELTNMAILAEEVGEVARIMSRRYGEQSEKQSDKNKDLADELSRCVVCAYLYRQSNGGRSRRGYE